MWLDIWNVVRYRTLYAYHISGHQPMQSLGNHEADTLAQIRWLKIHQQRTLPKGYTRSCDMLDKR